MFRAVSASPLVTNRHKMPWRRRCNASGVGMTYSIVLSHDAEGGDARNNAFPLNWTRCAGPIERKPP